MIEEISRQAFPAKQSMSASVGSTNFERGRHLSPKCT